MVVIQIKPHKGDRPWYLHENIRVEDGHHVISYEESLAIDEAKLFRSEKEAKQFVKEYEITDVLCYMEVDPVSMIERLRYKVERFRQTVEYEAYKLNSWEY